MKFLEDVGYSGSRHFDAHAYRSEDLDGVRAFARGCMRTYLAAERTRPASGMTIRDIQALLEESAASGRPRRGLDRVRVRTRRGRAEGTSRSIASRSGRAGWRTNGSTSSPIERLLGVRG